MRKFEIPKGVVEAGLNDHINTSENYLLVSLNADGVPTKKDFDVVKVESTVLGVKQTVKAKIPCVKYFGVVHDNMGYLLEINDKFYNVSDNYVVSLSGDTEFFPAIRIDDGHKGELTFMPSKQVDVNVKYITTTLKRLLSGGKMKASVNYKIYTSEALRRLQGVDGVRNPKLRSIYNKYIKLNACRSAFDYEWYNADNALPASYLEKDLSLKAMKEADKAYKKERDVCKQDKIKADLFVLQSFTYVDVEEDD